MKVFRLSDHQESNIGLIKSYNIEIVYSEYEELLRLFSSIIDDIVTLRNKLDS